MYQYCSANMMMKTKDMSCILENIFAQEYFSCFEVILQTNSIPSFFVVCRCKKSLTYGENWRSNIDRIVFCSHYHVFSVHFYHFVSIIIHIDAVVTQNSWLLFMYDVSFAIYRDKQCSLQLLHRRRVCVSNDNDQIIIQRMRKTNNDSGIENLKDLR